MHFGFLRVLNDGAFANYRPTEPMHGHRQSDTTTNLQAHVLIRLLLTMFSFERVWISFIPRKLPTRQPAYAPTCFPDVLGCSFPVSSADFWLGYANSVARQTEEGLPGSGGNSNFTGNPQPSK